MWRPLRSALVPVSGPTRRGGRRHPGANICTVPFGVAGERLGENRGPLHSGSPDAESAESPCGSRVGRDSTDSGRRNRDEGVVELFRDGGTAPCARGVGRFGWREEPLTPSAPRLTADTVEMPAVARARPPVRKICSRTAAAGSTHWRTLATDPFAEGDEENREDS